MFTVPVGNELVVNSRGAALIVTMAETCGDGASAAVAVIVTVPPVGGCGGAV
jgi:hypothetical protein